MYKKNNRFKVTMETSKQDPRFEGGGTPIGQIIKEPQQVPQQVPQHQIPQHQVPQHQFPQHQFPQQVPQHQIPQYQIPQYQIPQYQKTGLVEKFENFTNCKWQRVVALFLLVVILNNSFVYNFEKTLIPVSMRFGDPPLLAVFVNALLVVFLFLLISKFT